MFWGQTRSSPPSKKAQISTFRTTIFSSVPFTVCTFLDAIPSHRIGCPSQIPLPGLMNASFPIIVVLASVNFPNHSLNNCDKRQTERRTKAPQCRLRFAIHKFRCVHGQIILYYYYLFLCNYTFVYVVSAAYTYLVGRRSSCALLSGRRQRRRRRPNKRSSNNSQQCKEEYVTIIM